MAPGAMDPRDALEALRSMRDSCRANPDCPPAVLEAVNALIADYERKTA